MLNCRRRITRPLLHRPPDAILGTTFFSAAAPDSFGQFDRALLALFSVTAGMGWTSSLPAVRDDGSVDWGVAFYMTSFVIIANWTLLQVRGAARLLVGESHTIGEETRSREILLPSVVVYADSMEALIGCSESKESNPASQALLHCAPIRKGKRGRAVMSGLWGRAERRQVCVAILLDCFITAKSVTQQSEEEHTLREAADQRLFVNTLDPLLEVLCRSAAAA